MAIGKSLWDSTKGQYPGSSVHCDTYTAARRWKRSQHPMWQDCDGALERKECQSAGGGRVSGVRVK
jgi:hypothetical protein